VTLIIDTGPMVALADRRDRLQPIVERTLRDEPGDLIIPAPVTAEIDYLLGQRLGEHARLAFLDDLAEGRFRVACLEPFEYDLVRIYDRRYADLQLGLSDVSVAVLAHRFQTRRILTFDLRHFHALRALDGSTFEVLP
jgi:uncharacterized protein